MPSLYSYFAAIRYIPLLLLCSELRILWEEVKTSATLAHNTPFPGPLIVTLNKRYRAHVYLYGNLVCKCGCGRELGYNTVVCEQTLTI